MPIRLREGNHPKYRMVHATNHPDGCLLMVDNISARADKLFIDIQSGGQTSLFEQSVENEITNDDMLESKMCEYLLGVTEFTRLNAFLADFYNEYGVLCSISRLSSGKGGSILKTLESNGEIDVLRNPQTTKTGKTSKFWDYKKDIRLRKRS
ncbi:MAG: hypothetical protein FWG90_02680 [Oscillospiraceae bacterium]|nr:hypothetical protein [Oscillospiraceae bacterium]